MKLLNNNILIKPLEEKMWKQTQLVLDDEKNKDKDSTKDIMEQKEVEQDVAYEIQKAVVLEVSDPDGLVRQNDIVYYKKLSLLTPWRYEEGTFIMKPHDVVAVENNIKFMSTKSK